MSRVFRTPRPIVATAVVALAGAAAAAAAGTVSVTMNPNKAGKGTTFTLSAHGPYRGTGLPEVAFYVQRGFRLDPRAVATECPNAQVRARAPSCPSASKIGGGGGAGSATALGTNIPFTEKYASYLGVPRQHGDLASILLEGTIKSAAVGTRAASAIGRVLVLGSGPYGLEILIDKFNVPSAVSSLPITLNRFTLSGGAFRTARTGSPGHRHIVHYALVTTPPTCSGSWSGKFTASFPGGSTLSHTTSAACTN
jgi:hypothetical protein